MGETGLGRIELIKASISIMSVLKLLLAPLCKYIPDIVSVLVCRCVGLMSWSDECQRQ